MSRCHEEIIKCPNCGHETPFTIWESINTTLNPELKEKVRSDELFKFTCHHCGLTALVDYPFLYHQMEDKIMIYYTSNREDEYVNQLSKTRRLLEDKNNDLLSKIYKIEKQRVVATRAEFKEKLQILDAGLDDRVIEMMKLFVASYYFDDNPKGTIEDIYFIHSKDETKFIIKHDDNSWGSNNYIQELYDDLKKNYKDVLDREDNDLIVDAKWASNFIDTYHEQIKKDLLGNSIKMWDSQNDLLITKEKPILTEKEIKSPIDSFRWAYSLNTAKGFYVKSKEKSEAERLQVGKDSDALIANTFADLLFDDGKSIKKVFENIEVWPTNDYNSLMVFSSLLSKQTFIIDSRGDIFEIPCEIVERGRLRIERNFSNDKRHGCYKINGVNVYYRKPIDNEEGTKSVLSVDKNILNKEFNKFIRKTSKEEKEYLYLTVGDSKCGSFVKYFASNGMKFEVVPNVLNDDDTINVRIPLDEENATRKDVQFLSAKYSNDYSVYGLSYESISGGLKLNKRNMYYLPKGKEVMIYSIIDTLGKAYEAKDDNEVYRKFTLKLTKLFERGHKKQFKNEFSDILLKHPNDIDVNISYVKDHLEYISELMLRCERKGDNEELIDKYGDINYSKYKSAYELSKKLYTEKMEEYENKVLENIEKLGQLTLKGKNESTLFALVIKEYPNAIYQFHSDWLEGLSLDIYVPNLKVAIEYHGQQHYGINDMYRQKVMENDRLKKHLCQENGVKLIEWEFDEPIGKSKLHDKIEKILKQ